MDTKTYAKINENEAFATMKYVEEETWKLIDHCSSIISKEEREYFRKSFPMNKRVPQFYGMPKVHKNKLPMPFRPVVSQCGSVFGVISIFADFKLQRLTEHIPSYILNSTSFLDDIDLLGSLPSTAKLFTADTVGMYSNIHPAEALPKMEAYLNLFGHELTNLCRMKIEFIIKLTRLVMLNNIFKFGNTWWKQIVGTAMGTSCACVYATITFAYEERTLIQTKYSKNLGFYKRKIDDIFAVWLSDPSNPTAWDSFNKDLNSCSSLDWNVEELADSVDFLDLTLYIDPTSRKIQYRTYQKPMNLFLYIPHHSAHTPGLLKSLAYGLISTYKRQNSSEDNFKLNVKKLFERLLARGYEKETLVTLFNEVAAKLDQKSLNKPGNKTITDSILSRTDSPLFFHLPYHPKGVSRSFIQQSYKNICEKPDELGESFRKMKTESGGTMKVPKLTVAYNRAQNLRDVLTPSTLEEFDDCTVQNLLETIQLGK